MACWAQRAVGCVISRTWSATYTPFVHQNWMRDYDPTTGRYLQPDPLGLVDGASVYGYALQSPLRYTDPRGLWVAGPQSGRLPDYNPYTDDLVQCDGVTEVCRLKPGGQTYSGDKPGSRDGIPLLPYTTCIYECGEGANKRTLIRVIMGNAKCPSIVTPRPTDQLFPSPQKYEPLPSDPMVPSPESTIPLWLLLLLLLIPGPQPV